MNNISLKGVSKSYGGNLVLDNVSLEIASGEFFSLLGPSGCGKTTLLRIIGGFNEADGGVVCLGGKDISLTPANQRPVNTIFQKYALFPHLNVYENIAFSFRVKGLSKAESHEKVMHYAHMARLEKHMEKLPSMLSGGQQQRVAIARALANEPRVLLLDEPLSALDAKLRQHMLIELDRIHDEVGITFILVTHDQEEALSVSDHIAVMNEGRILQVGTPVQLYETPADAFVADFIGENNFIEGKVARILDAQHAEILSPMGSLVIELDKAVKEGQKVTLTVRPEKIEVLKNKPKLPNQWHNLIKGTVSEVIYSGFQTKYFLNVPGVPAPVKAFEQHDIFFEDGTETVHWNEEAWFLWDADDSYVVEVSD